MALCGAFARHGLDAGGIDTAIRSSGLYRDKWERDDYRNSTIAMALQRVTVPAAGQQPASVQNVPLAPSVVAGGPGIAGGGLLNTTAGKIAISTQTPPPRDYIVDGLLLPGKSAVLAGFGGTFKTQFSLQLATSIALGLPFMGRTVKLGNVLAILGEEDRPEVCRRLSAIARRQKLSRAQINLVERNLLAFPLVGCDVRLTAHVKEGLRELAFARDIINAAKAMGDVVLIVLDHLALFHGGDHNAREDAALTMRVVNHMAQESGAAVLLLAHTPKGASVKEESDASMVAGSTAFVDQARGAWVLSTMRPTEAKTFGIPDKSRSSYASLTVVKNNYGPTGDVIWFERVAFDGVGLLEQINLIAPIKSAAGLDAKIVAFVRTNPGQYSKTKFRETQSGKDGPMKASKGEVERVVEELLKDNRLVNRAPSAQERAQFGFGPRVTHVLDIGVP